MKQFLVSLHRVYTLETILSKFTQSIYLRNNSQ